MADGFGFGGTEDVKAGLNQLKKSKIKKPELRDIAI
jgi:hypothetical protein